ncbi:MAG: MoxR family ATPase [Microcystis aeruginosa LL13-03]|jgi:MoxR-like ATPase|nr:MoxR family ATPase [Microcystis aeruginosa SX13-11]NCR18077.1 MoxR family ATPase [Microcystis aeruginosa LL13-03]NCR67822.1 MoxR family ATPase [Microcystis aeruginosa LL11-07]NCR90400.1 MoxR family ATPase [Microcystis aeruginosa G13-10]NCS16779.1 MoxR family ATPase [Microcystis aeruginosa G13-12]NCS20435.1 MoxR family ATPase [Microcystis aeruginosa G11-06]NCS35711.1 MoxR family ATPase [Microcystis aeruginosa G11-01]NCT51944.1 MoxR family ATPase [Microcystis aeruginosa G13-03]
MEEVIQHDVAPKYTDRVQPVPGELDASGRSILPYIPNDDLVESVNLAIQLERPLLLKGEPGCGKTQLAYSVAYSLNLPFEAWYVKSTSRARDGLYTYDTVGRLRDAQLAAARQFSKEEEIQQIQDPSTYVRLGPLGRTFLKERRAVVLIDEIDKADIDFPNDLLLEIDERRFIIEETGEEIRAKYPPIVFITSNDEKELPNAFLRRCLFHYIEFPSRERLIKIIQAHFPTAQETLLQKSIDGFQKLRQEMQADESGRTKLVSTSELIDWFRILHSQPHDVALAKLDGNLPYLGTLLKSREDQIRHLKKSKRNE